MWIHPRLKAHIPLPLHPQLIWIGPEPNGQTGQICRAQCCRLRDARPHHRNAEQVCLELHHQIVDCRSAVDTQCAQRSSRVAVYCIEHVRDLKGDAFQRRSNAMCPGFRIAAKAYEQSTRMRIPMWCSEANKRRYKHDSTRIGHSGGKRLHLGRRADKSKIVAQPLHHRAADEDAALKRILKPLLRACRDRSDQLVLREPEPGADVLQKEAARTIGVFGLARVPAKLAEQRGLLIASDSCDRDSAEAKRCGDVPDHTETRPHNLGQDAGRVMSKIIFSRS